MVYHPHTDISTKIITNSHLSPADWRGKVQSEKLNVLLKDPWTEVETWSYTNRTNSSAPTALQLQSMVYKEQTDLTLSDSGQKGFYFKLFLSIFVLMYNGLSLIHVIQRPIRTGNEFDFLLSEIKIIPSLVEGFHKKLVQKQTLFNVFIFHFWGKDNLHSPICWASREKMKHMWQHSN